MILTSRALLLIRRAGPKVPSGAACRTLTNATASQGCSKDDVLNLLNRKQPVRNDMAYSLSFGDDRAFSLSSMVEPSALMREQLEYSRNQLRHSSSMPQKRQPQTKMDNFALPKTLEDVIRQKSRAIVVTEMAKPFRIVDVNQCWEGLCGYTFSEARGQTLGSLLQGPDTNQVAATGLVAHLLEGEEAGAVLTNYTKDGREFRNRIRVGPLYDESGDNVTHFVGVLEEIKEEQYM